MDSGSVAQCALHHDTTADRTCARCGRFACADCLRERDLCSGCAQVVGDPYLLKRPFNLFEVVPTAARIAWAELPRVVVLTAVFSLPSAALSQATSAGDDLSALSSSIRWSNLYELLVGTLGGQTMLALYIARAEGRVITLAQAFREALSNWGRAAGALFRVNLWTLLFTLLFVLPGIWQAVLLMFARVAVLRARPDDALETSRKLVRGRFWTVFGLAAAVFALVLVSIVFSTIAGALVEETPIPAFALELVADFVTRLCGDGFALALLYVGFVMLHVTAGTPLAPMRWSRQLPYRQSHS